MTKDIFPSVSLSQEFLSRLVADIDGETVRAIILHGSYVRGDAYPPYSDIDLVRILYETPERKQQKRFIWYDSYLLNLSSRPLSLYKEWLTIPQEAILRISTIRDAHILQDKDGAFREFQQEVITTWTWEPLQDAANRYASQLLVEQTEIILKILRALQEQNIVTLIDMIVLELLSVIPEAIAVQQGILVKSGNSYLRQVQESVGLESEWTRSYMTAAGEANGITPSLTLEQRGLAALRLYKETIQLLKHSLDPEHKKTIEKLIGMID